MGSLKQKVYAILPFCWFPAISVFMVNMVFQAGMWFQLWTDSSILRWSLMVTGWFFLFLYRIGIRKDNSRKKAMRSMNRMLEEGKQVENET